MRNILLSICLLMAVVTRVSAQHSAERVSGRMQTTDQVLASYQQWAGNNGALFTGRFVMFNYQSAWVSHPFLGDEDLHQGKVSFRGVVYSDVSMRYDLYNDELQVLTPATNHLIIPDQFAIDWFELGGNRYIRTSGGFFRQDYGGRSVSLLTRVSKVQGSDVFINDKAFHQFEQKERTMMATPSDTIEVKNLRGVRKALPQYDKELTEYGSKHQLSFKSGRRVESLRSLARYADGLHSASVAAHRGETPSRVSSSSSARQLVPSAARTIAVDAVSTDSLPQYYASLYDVYREGSTMKVEVNDDEKQDEGAGDVFRDIRVEKEDRVLDEVVIVSFHSKVNMLQTGAEKFRPSMLRTMPMSMGEADVMKMVQTLPGVSSVGEASSGFNVRGGASDQNLMLLGSNTIYNPMHMFGLFSVINTDALGEVELYKSSVPSQYGGRVSSVMKMNNRVGDKQKWNGSASLGLLTSKAMLDIPIVKNKLSLMLAGRTTYSDWMLKLLPEKNEYRDGQAGFYDLNAGLSWNVNTRHIVNLNGYYSHDRFSFTPDDKYAYANGNGSLEWKGYWNDRFSTTLQAGFDHYDYQNDDSKNEYREARLTFGISQAFLKGLFSLRTGDRNTLRWGWDGLSYMLQPGIYEPLGEWSAVRRDELEKQNAMQMAVFAEDEWKPSDKWSVTAGARYTIYHAMQEGRQKTYQAPELRIAGAYFLPHHQSLKVGFGNMTQFIHKVSNTVIMSPTDTWALSNSDIRPQRGWQATAGYYWRSENSVYEISLETYIKRMQHYPTYGNAAQLVMNHNLPADLIDAQGKAYGVELQLKKTTGRLTGWISYAYARTFLRQNDKSLAWRVNDGKWYPADFDHPHELNLVSNFKFTKRYSMSLNIDYSTGRPTTIPVGSYYDEKRHEYMPYYSERNGYRMPDNFRMDISFNIAPTHHITSATHSWFSIGCYNVTAHHNVYSIYYEMKNRVPQGYKLSIFGAPIPYISYNIKF